MVRFHRSSGPCKSARQGHRFESCHRHLWLGGFLHSGLKVAQSLARSRHSLQATFRSLFFLDISAKIWYTWDMTDAPDILVHCERCGKFLVPTNRIVLELRLGTDSYYQPGILDPEDSQGCFVFGKDCAKRILEGSDDA